MSNRCETESTDTPAANGAGLDDDTNGSLNVVSERSINGKNESQVPIAICGIGIRLPGGICDDDRLWASMVNGLDARDLSHDEKMDYLDSSLSTEKDEPDGCNLSDRKLLEVTNECLEDACEANYRGEDARVAFHVAMPRTGLTGNDSQDMITQTEAGNIAVAKRVSRRYDLQGPSMSIHRPNGSASLVALHKACSSLRSGHAKAAIVASIADGFEEGEAVSAVYIKPLPDAIRDGNPIRGVIRATGAAGLDSQSAGVVEVSGEIAYAVESCNIGDMRSASVVEAVLSLERGHFANADSETARISNNNSIKSFRVAGPGAHAIIIDSYPPLLTANAARPELLLFSANHPISLDRQIQLHHDFAQTHPQRAADLAFTRAVRREALRYRAFSILGSDGKVANTSNHAKCPPAAPSITMVFSGQGAQWAGMGKGLIHSDAAFREDVERMDGLLRQLKKPPTWTIQEEIRRQSDDPLCRINSAEPSYPLSTALQIALFHHFERLGVMPKAVVGHSSGEIAAAYAAGHLNLKDALAVAYYYGYVTAKNMRDGAMAAVSLSVEETNRFLRDGVVIACENSPMSTTISGDRLALDQVLASIEAARPDASTRKLHVDVAHHSPHMEPLSDELSHLLKAEGIASTDSNGRHAMYMSSMRGELLDQFNDFGADYWIDNLVSPVRFHSAVASLISLMPGRSLFLEVGPHSTLSSPLSQICAASNVPCSYVPSQMRDSDSLVSFFSAVGRLWQESAVPNLGSLFIGKAISGLPKCPLDHPDSGLSESHASESSAKPSAKEKMARIVAHAMSLAPVGLSKDDMLTTELELVLRALWVEVLRNVAHTRAADIGKKHGFFPLGGDSITAIELATLAHRHGISLAPAEITRCPELASMAAIAKIVEDEAVSETAPFSLIPKDDVDDIKDQVRNECQLTSQLIQDIYPCTPLQAGLMALGTRNPGSYIHRQVHKLSPDADPGRFKAAWNETVQRCETLRTRVVLVGGQAIQAVISDDTTWEQAADVDVHAFLNASRTLEMSYGDRLCRYALVQHNGESHFVWIIHHVVFDGLSMRIVLDTLYRTYHRADLGVLRPYHQIIKYIQSLDSEAASQYWKTALHGAKRSPFPAGRLSVASQVCVMKKAIPFRNTTSFTTATILRAAWAIVLARYCDTDDVCFGTTISGRQAPVPGLNEIPGPMIATIPVRVQLGQGPVSHFLRSIQLQALDMVAHEQFGLQNISKLSQDAQDACRFASFLVIQPAQHLTSIAETASDALLHRGSLEQTLTPDDYFKYPLVIQCLLNDNHIELNLTYSTNMVPEAQTQALCQHISHVVQQLLASDDMRLQAVSLSSAWDLQQAMNWNRHELQVEEHCIHDLIAKQAALSPNDEALFSTEGAVTYAMLERLSDYVAGQLCQYNVQPETIVPFCMEKSVWAVVAMIGIMKAGGAFMPLDPSHAESKRAALVLSRHG